ncbi:MAG: polymer-forming cytoskeletal protein, partial [Hyphomicrobiaceae bacterium]
IGTDLTILGEGITIISKNNLRVDGDVRGNVAGKEVVIGPEGSVTGTVSAEKIDVFGGVRGAITSVEVALHDSAQVEGEITHETMTMAQGAYFEGKVRRLTDRTELASKLDPSSYAASAASAS